MSEAELPDFLQDPAFLDQFNSWEDVLAFLENATGGQFASELSRNGVDPPNKQAGGAPGKVPDSLLSAMNKPGAKPFSYLGGVDLKQQLQGMKDRRKQATQPKGSKGPPQLHTPVSQLHAPVSARPAPATITSTKTANTSPFPAGSGAADLVHAQYNSPMPVYSDSNITESYIAQSGAKVHGAQERPKKDAPESEVAKFIRESESGQQSRRGQPEAEESEFRPGSDPHKQSMSFRVLQWMTDTEKTDSSEDKDAQRRKREKDPELRHNSEDDEMRFTGLNRGRGIPSKSFHILQKLTVNDEGTEKSPASKSQQYLSPNGTENDGDQVSKYDETSIRYKGKYIPSPAFRVLQNWAELDPLEVDPSQSQHVPDRRDDEDEQNNSDEPIERRYKGGNIPSRVFKTLQMAVGDDQQPENEASSAKTQSISQAESNQRSIRVIQKPTESAGATDF